MREKYEREKQRESINALRNDISNFRSCVIYLSSSTMSHQKRLNTFPGQREGIPEGVVRMNYDRVHANISNNEQQGQYLNTFVIALSTNFSLSNFCILKRTRNENSLFSKQQLENKIQKFKKKSISTQFIFFLPLKLYNLFMGK